MRTIKMLYVVLAIMLFANIAIAQNPGKYGGIPSSVTNPPEGTTISAEMSAYYNMPVATTKIITYEGVFWYVGGYGWFNRDELRNLPAKSLMYGISPYDCNADDSCGSTATYTPVIRPPATTPIVEIPNMPTPPEYCWGGCN